MNFFRSIISAAAVIAVSFAAVSCEESVKIESSSSVEAELEKKYNRNFDFIQQTTNEKKNYFMKFADDKGVEFTVRCYDHTGLAPRITGWDYIDDYIEKYIEKFGDEYLADIKEKGINYSFTDRSKSYAGVDITLNSKTLIFYITDISQIDEVYAEIEKLDPPLLYSLKNYVKSSEDARLCTEDRLIEICNYGIEKAKENYKEIINENDDASEDKNSVSSE